MVDGSPSSIPNQDWLLVNAPAIPFGDITSYAKTQWLIENRASPGDRG